MTEASTHSEPQQAKSSPGILLGISVVSAILCVGLGLSSPAAFWAGYLVAAIFWLSVSIGSVAIVLVYGTSGGRWGRAIGRSLHAGIGTLPVSLLGFWLLAIGASTIFPWAGSASQQATLNENQQVWLAPTAVAAKFAIISVIWLLIGRTLNIRHRREANDPSVILPQEPAAIGLIIFFVTYSIVAVDFMMSLSPGWFSSMYPLIRILNCSVSALALCAIWHNRRIVNPTLEQADRLQDIGNLLQAFNLMWTYLAFSQYILIWTGDIADEVQWYIDRRTPLWMCVSIALFALHFVLPFLLLLSRDLKRHPKSLSAIAGLLLTMCVVDIAWTVIPSIAVPSGLALLSMVASLLAVGGIWQTVFRWSFDRLPDVPVGTGHDPDAQESIEEAMENSPGDFT